MKISLLAITALTVACCPAALAGQEHVTGFIAPDGPPRQPPVRVDAGGACVVDLVQDYTLEGAVTGELTLDYRILVAGPCGSPPGTFDEEWIAHGSFSGTASGQEATATVLYTARAGVGGRVTGTISFGGGMEGELEVTGEFSDRRLTYSGRVRWGEKRSTGEISGSGSVGSTHAPGVRE